MYVWVPNTEKKQEGSIAKFSKIFSCIIFLLQRPPPTGSMLVWQSCLVADITFYLVDFLYSSACFLLLLNSQV